MIGSAASFAPTRLRERKRYTSRSRLRNGSSRPMNDALSAAGKKWPQQSGKGRPSNHVEGSIAEEGSPTDGRNDPMRRPASDTLLSDDEGFQPRLIAKERFFDCAGMPELVSQYAGRCNRYRRSLTGEQGNREAGVPDQRHTSATPMLRLNLQDLIVENVRCVRGRQKSLRHERTRLPYRRMRCRR